MASWRWGGGVSTREHIASWEFFFAYDTAWKRTGKFEAGPPGWEEASRPLSPTPSPGLSEILSSLLRITGRELADQGQGLWEVS